jgi:hypothetical protein
MSIERMRMREKDISFKTIGLFLPDGFPDSWEIPAGPTGFVFTGIPTTRFSGLMVGEAFLPISGSIPSPVPGLFLFQEKISAKNRNRPEFRRVLDHIREGDTIVVWKLDRLARSTRDLLETMETIREAGGRFQSISEPWADTTSHAGKMIMTIFAGIAEFERDLIRERTGAGREAAKKRGVRFGRPRKLTLDQGELARRLVSEGKAVREIASVFKVHPATIYRLAAI